MNISDSINEIISSFQQLPYLFIGTGMSIRYANAPDWNSLLENAWKAINPDSSDIDYKKWVQGIERKLETDNTDISDENKKYLLNPLLASELEENYDALFYSSKLDFFTDEDEQEILDYHYTPFKYYISKLSKQISLDKDKDTFNEISDLIKNQSKIAGIITTNYDCILESLFPDFEVLVGQDNLILSNTINIFEIFKIHGCCNDPSSIILTDRDYDRFNKRLKYLSAKLLTIFIEHPIIFLGYGLRDLNIRKLFTEIAECLTREQLHKIKNNFIFVTIPTDGKEYVTKTRMDFGSGEIVMNEIALNDFSCIYNALSNIQSSMPVKLARKLQNMVTEFVYSAEAKNTVVFGSIDSPDIDDDKAAIYVGKKDTIAEIGFDYYEIMDILEDVLFDNRPALINEKLITKTFKNIRSRAGKTLLPVYKYCKALNYSLDDINSNYYIIHDYSDIEPNSSEESYCSSKKFDSVNEIVSAFPDHIPKQIANIKKSADTIDTEELGDYLRKRFNDKDFQSRYSSAYKKMIALYDFKKYK